MTSILHPRSKTRAIPSWLVRGVCPVALLSIALLSAALWTPPLHAQTSTQENGPNIAATIAGDVKPEQPAHIKTKKDNKANQKAEDAYLAGARLLNHHNTVAAEKEFARAAELAPDNRDYALALASVREAHVTELVQGAGKARILGRSTEAERLLDEARKIDPDNSILLQHPDPSRAVDPRKLHSWLIDGPRVAGPIQLKPTTGNQTLHIHAPVAEIARQVMDAYGIKATLDPSVGNKQARLDLEDVPYAQALHILMDMGQLFVVPLTTKSALVVKDNQENRQKFEHQVQETIYSPGMTNEQIAELGNMIKSVFEVRQISVQNSFGTLVVRAPEETIRVLNLTLSDLIDGGSEVMFDLKLYSVDQTSTTNIGATLPTQAGAYNVLTAANQLVSANQSLVDQAIAQGIIPAGASNIEIAVALLQSGLVTSTLLTNTLRFLGGGTTATGIYSSATPTFNLSLNASDTRALDEIQLRVGDRQSATFRAGSKYPITQSTYATTAPTAATSALSSATVNGVSVASLLGSATTSTVPQVQYEDLGVTLKATPTVQKSGLISVHLDLKIESLAGGSIDNIPILNSNQFTSDVTVQDGGTAYLVSNLTKSQAAAVAGVPGLSELPGFQSSPDLLKTTDVSQLLMVLTPHLTRRRSNESASPAFPISLAANSSE